MNPFKKVPQYDPDELFQTALERSRKALPEWRGRRDPVRISKRYAKARIESLYDFLAHRFRKIVTEFPNLDELHPFYREMLLMFFDEDEIKKALGGLRGLARVLDKIKVDLIRRLKVAASKKEVYEIRREALGRARDVMKKARRYLELLNRVTRYMSRLPNYIPDLPAVVIAGPPNVGKSSIANAISSAKSEVARYPFTTRETIFGHMKAGAMTIQVIDTPGLLERTHFDELTEIERRAIAAIRGAEGILLFVFDASDESYPPEEQIRIFENMIRLYRGNKRVIAAINKIDIANEENLKKLEEYLREKGIPYVKVSALTGEGLKDLKKLLLESSLYSYDSSEKQKDHKADKPTSTNGVEQNEEYKESGEERDEKPAAVRAFFSYKGHVKVIEESR